MRSIRARDGDVYLLCSDGLTTMIGEDVLADVLVSHERLRDAGKALIAAANAAGGKDNITVVLVRVEEILTEAELGDGHTTGTLVPAPQAPSTPRARPDPPNRGAHSDAIVRDEAQAPPGQAPVLRRRPRSPAPVTQPSRGARLRRRMRRLRAPLVALVVVGMLGAGAYLALQSVYFIATNQRGLVTMYRGVPYELPGAIKLYSSDYVSGVSASTLPAARRQALLDHSLRSEGDAADLMRQLELGQLSGG